jgi:recombination DNA repair RAD52 pathway protein
MVLPRKTKSIGIRQELNNSTKKRKTPITNSKQKSLHTSRKKLTKVNNYNKKTLKEILKFSFLACGFK